MCIDSWFFNYHVILAIFSNHYLFIFLCSVAHETYYPNVVQKAEVYALTSSLFIPYSNKHFLARNGIIECKNYLVGLAV